MRTLALAAALLAALARPAAAAVPPMDLTRGELAVAVGVPAAGVDLSLGRLVVGAAATGFAVPALVYGYGFEGHVGWRLSGLPRREVAVGLVLLGGAGSTAWRASSNEAWFVQPALALAMPLGAGATLRAAGGPIFFQAVRVDAGVRDEGRGLLPFVPNVELGVRLAEGQELLLGGLPNVVGWRGTF